MAEPTAGEWHAARTVRKFASLDELLSAMKENPEEFELPVPDSETEARLREDVQAALNDAQETQDDVQGTPRAAAFHARAAAGTLRGTAVNTTDNSAIPLPVGCTNFPPNSKITAVTINGPVVLLPSVSCQFGLQYLPLWPDRLGYDTVRAIPAGWQTTARSARAF
jgi:hypothetical protein